jgi:ABC-type sugar transport system ATPase subunit
VGLSAPGLNLSLPDPLNRGPHLGRPNTVTLGVRAEDIILGETQARGEVVLVESLGNEQIVTVSLGETELVLRTAAHPKLRMGEILDFGLRTDKLHFFSPVTGERIAFR